MFCLVLRVLVFCPVNSLLSYLLFGSFKKICFFCLISIFTILSKVTDLKTDRACLRSLVAGLAVLALPVLGVHERGFSHRACWKRGKNYTTFFFPEERGQWCLRRQEPVCGEELARQE